MGRDRPRPRAIRRLDTNHSHRFTLVLLALKNSIPKTWVRLVNHDDSAVAVAADAEARQWQGP